MGKRGEINMYRFALRFGRRERDLIALSETKGFTDQVKKCLLAFVNGKKYDFKLPHELPVTAKIKKRVDVTFKDKDQAVIDFIKSIEAGNRNTVMIIILRGFLPFPIVSPYLLDDGIYYSVFTDKKSKARRKAAQKGNDPSKCHETETFSYDT